MTPTEWKCSWCRGHSLMTAGRCVYCDSPSPSAEPLKGLREAIIAELRLHMLNIESWYPRTADALLAGPLAPLLDRLREAEVVRREAEAAE